MGLLEIRMGVSDEIETSWQELVALVRGEGAFRVVHVWQVLAVATDADAVLRGAHDMVAVRQAVSDD